MTITFEKTQKVFMALVLQESEEVKYAAKQTAESQVMSFSLARIPNPVSLTTGKRAIFHLV